MDYVPMLKAALPQVLPGLLATVGPQGTILFVTHDISDLQAGENFTPQDYCQPADIVHRLGFDWIVRLAEKRRRSEARQGAGHVHDAILRARRIG